MLTYITIDGGLPAAVLAYAGDLFTDLNLVIYLAVGLPMAFYIIRRIISLVRTR